MRRNDDGSTTEAMPEGLNCGHPSANNVESVSYAAETPDVRHGDLQPVMRALRPSQR